MKSLFFAAVISLGSTLALAQGAPADTKVDPKADAKSMRCQDKDAPTGCKMMSADEMKAHHEKMRGMKDKKSCMAYMEEHHKAMQERAAKSGEKLPAKPDSRGCMGMK